MERRERGEVKIDVLARSEADFDDEMVPLDANKIAKEVDEAKEVALSALKTSQKNASLSTGCHWRCGMSKRREIEIVESMDEE